MTHQPEQSLQTHRRGLVRLTTGAERAGVKPATVRQWIADGRLTGYRQGPRLIFVDPDELDGLVTVIPTNKSA